MQIWEREKHINWWVGRFSDADLAEWTGMSQRAVGIVLSLPQIKSGVSGGGRGSKHTRRVNSSTRNAVAIIQALNQAGLTFELAANIIHSVPSFASSPTDIVDYKNLTKDNRILCQEDPEGNWMVSDVVPWHIWERKVYPCAKEGIQEIKSLGDLNWIDSSIAQNDQEKGKISVSWSDDGSVTTYNKFLSNSPVYQGEIDPLGLYDPGTSNSCDIATPKYDCHIIIVNGEWVFEKSPLPSAIENLQMFLEGNSLKEEEIFHQNTLILRIHKDKKTVAFITEEEKKAAIFSLDNFDSRLEVNTTLAVRKMKRKALGLVRDTIEIKRTNKN